MGNIKGLRSILRSWCKKGLIFSHTNYSLAHEEEKKTDTVLNFSSAKLSTSVHKHGKIFFSGLKLLVWGTYIKAEDQF